MTTSFKQWQIIPMQTEGQLVLATIRQAELIVSDDDVNVTLRLHVDVAGPDAPSHRSHLNIAVRSTSPATEKRGHQRLYTLRAALGFDLLDAGQLIGKTILIELKERAELEEMED